MTYRPFGKRSLDELSDEQVVIACERNYIDYWSCAGARPWADFSEDGGITRAITGLPNEIFNVVLKCELDPDMAEDAIDTVIDDFRERRIPLLWHVGLLTEPKDLGRHLESRGFPHDYDLRAMAVDLDSIEEPAFGSSGARVETVANEIQARQWIECLSSSWHLPREVPEWMARNPCFNVAIEHRGSVTPNRRMYLGFLRDEPVSASMLFWSGEVAGVQAVGTIPAAQGRSAGSAAVGAALRDARAMGHKTAVVLSTVEGVRLYEKLGFRAFGRLPEHSMRFDQDR